MPGLFIENPNDSLCCSVIRLAFLECTYFIVPIKVSIALHTWLAFRLNNSINDSSLVACICNAFN